MSLPDPPPLETLPLVCPHCRGAFQVRTEFRGQPVACPLCQQVVEVPRQPGLIPPPPPSTEPPPFQLPPTEAPETPVESPASRMGNSPVRDAQEVEQPKNAPSGRANDPSYQEPEPPRQLTREERERLRLRLRIITAVIGGIILAIALAVLLNV